MSETFYGMVRTRTFEGGLAVWAPTYTPDDMLKSEHDYIPCESIEAGVETIKAVHPAPDSQDAKNLTRVFLVKSRSSDVVEKVITLPHPMLTSTSDIRNRQGETAAKLRALIASPESKGVILLPSASAVYRAVGLDPDGYYDRDRITPKIDGGNKWRHTTVTTFLQDVRKSSDFALQGVVVSRVNLRDGDGPAHAVRYDPKRAAVNAKAVVTRAANREKREQEQAARAKAAAEANDRRYALQKLWDTLGPLGAKLIRDVPAYENWHMSTPYHPSRWRHPVYVFQRYVQMYERLFPKSPMGWRNKPAVRKAMLALHAKRAELAGPDDPFGVPDANGKAVSKVASVRRALTWFWGHVDAIVPKRARRPRAKTG